MMIKQAANYALPGGVRSAGGAASMEGGVGGGVGGGGGANSVLPSKKYIIVQLGHKYSRAGISGEPTPRVCISTNELSEHVETDIGTHCYDMKEWIPIVEKIIKKLLFELRCSLPATQPLLLLHSVSLPTPVRDAAIHILNENYSEIYLCPESVAPLYLMGTANGIVLDVGSDSTRVTPVGSGFYITDCENYTRIGMNDVCRKFRELLVEQGEALLADGTKKKISQCNEASNYLRVLTDDFFEQLISRVCYVRYELKDGFKFESKDDITIPATGGTKILINAKIRWSACEELFIKQNSREAKLRNKEELLEKYPYGIPLSVEELIYELILQLHDRYLGPTLIQNILPVGGGSCLRGFKERLALEILNLVENQKTIKYLAQFAIIGDYIGSASSAQWAGASIWADQTIPSDLPSLFQQISFAGQQQEELMFPSPCPFLPPPLASP